MKGKIVKFLLFLALILLPWGVIKAADTKTGDSIYVASDEIISGNFYAAGNNITIDGAIGGDLIVLGQTVTVNGRIEGDIIVAAQTININGEAGGNIRIAGNAIIINGQAARNLNAFGSSVTLGDNSRVGWDAYILGSNLEMRGIIDGDLSGRAGQALVSGKIGKDVDLKISDSGLGGSLVISPEAVINGDFNYTAKKVAQISDQASISGQTNHNLASSETKNNFTPWLWSKLYAIFSALVVGLVLITLGKNITSQILEKLSEKTLHHFLPGLIVLLILPPIALVLLFTIIGIPLALVIMAWWLVASYIAKIITAILLGQLVLTKLIKKDNSSLVWSLIIGVIISWLLFALPFVGWLLGLIAITIGLGGIWSYASNQLKHL